MIVELAEDTPAAPQAALKADPAGAFVGETDGPVLIVEDNYLMALDLMTSLERLERKDAELAALTEQPDRSLEHFKVSLAILDINLGRGGTSVAFAQKLEQLGVPVFFITGYGDHAPVPPKFLGKRKLQKPIALVDLKAAITGTLPEARAA